MRIPRAVYRSAAVLGVGATGGVGSTPGKGKGSGRGSVTKERGRSRGPFGVARRWGGGPRPEGERAGDVWGDSGTGGV